MNDALEKAREAALQALINDPDILHFDGGVAVEAIDQFIASLKDQGLVIVPVEATEEMCEAVAFGPYTTISHGGRDSFEYFSEDNARAAYAAMLAAATQPSQPHDPLQQAPSGKASEDG